MAKNMMTVVLGLAAVSLLGVCLYQRQEIRQLGVRQKAYQEQTEEKIELLESKLSVDAERKRAAVASAKATAATDKAVSAVTQPVIAAAEAKVEPAPEKEAPMAGLAQMLKSPGMKDMIRAQQKGQQDVMYGSLFKCLQLSEEGMAKFKDLLLDRQMGLVDSSMDLMSGTATPEEKKAAGEKIKELTAAYDAEIKALLGEDNYGLFKSYEDTQAERMQVTMFKGSLSEDVQMSDAQEDSLIRAMHEARSSFKSSVPGLDGKQESLDPSQFTPEGITRLLEESARLQEQYVAKAAAILTPAQLELFKANQKQQQAMQEMGMNMAAKMFGQPAKEKVPVTP